jgi:RES domain-containing protein
LRKAWRLVRRKRLSDAFTGEGARLGGGRWNHPGTRVVYVSESLSLAALEQFIHFTRNDIALARTLLAIPVEIPAELKVIEVSREVLEKDWRLSPPSDSTRDIGTQWVEKARSAVLRVPSAIIPEECNLLLNPQHRDFEKIRIGKERPFALDDRMWK